MPPRPERPRYLYASEPKRYYGEGGEMKRLDGTDRYPPAAPEGEGASGAGVEPVYDVFMEREHLRADLYQLRRDKEGQLQAKAEALEALRSELASLRADRDRLERSSNAWQDRAEALEEQQRELIPTVQRLERELEEARRERDEAGALLDANLEELDHRRDENRRLMNALREAEAGLELAVARLDKVGNTWLDATERQALRLVRHALHAPTTEDGAPESVGTHPDGTTGPDMCESER